jgi:hypothetical protein
MEDIGVNGKSLQARISWIIGGCKDFPFGFSAIVAFILIVVFSSAYVCVCLRLRIRDFPCDSVVNCLLLAPNSCLLTYHLEPSISMQF